MIVTLDPEQVHLLEEAGYRWLATTDVWINQKASRAISSETVGRHTRAWLVRWLKREVTRGATSTSAVVKARRRPAGRSEQSLHGLLHLIAHELPDDADEVCRS